MYLLVYCPELSVNFSFKLSDCFSVFHRGVAAIKGAVGMRNLVIIGIESLCDNTSKGARLQRNRWKL